MYVININFVENILLLFNIKNVYVESEITMVLLFMLKTVFSMINQNAKCNCLMLLHDRRTFLKIVFKLHVAISN